jgi:hypothetical protein
MMRPEAWQAHEGFIGPCFQLLDSQDPCADEHVANAAKPIERLIFSLHDNRESLQPHILSRAYGGEMKQGQRASNVSG